MEAVVTKAVKGRRHLGEHAWRDAFERFGSAGLTVEEFCRREGLCRSSFTRWRSRVRGEAVHARAPEQAAGEKASASFVDLGPLGAEAAVTQPALELRVELGGGLTLSLMRR